jgi:hypothetical protein
MRNAACRDCWLNPRQPRRIVRPSGKGALSKGFAGLIFAVTVKTLAERIGALN